MITATFSLDVTKWNEGLRAAGQPQAHRSIGQESRRERLATLRAWRVNQSGATEHW
jgi:hypothetical protein